MGTYKQKRTKRRRSRKRRRRRRRRQHAGVDNNPDGRIEMCLQKIKARRRRWLSRATELLEYSLSPEAAPNNPQFGVCWWGQRDLQRLINEEERQKEHLRAGAVVIESDPGLLRIKVGIRRVEQQRQLVRKMLAQVKIANQEPNLNACIERLRHRGGICELFRQFLPTAQLQSFQYALDNMPLFPPGPAGLVQNPGELINAFQKLNNWDRVHDLIAIPGVYAQAWGAEDLGANGAAG